MLHVVESEHRIEQHESGFVGAVGSRAQIAENRLEPGRGAVPEVADGAAGESRQVGYERRSVVGHETAQRLDEWPLAFHRRSAPLDDRAPLTRRERQKRILAEERIAPDVLAALDALKEERVVGVLGDL